MEAYLNKYVKKKKTEIEKERCQVYICFNKIHADKHISDIY